MNIFNILIIVTLFYTFEPLYNPTAYINWNNVTSILDTNNVNNIYINEDDKMATIYYNKFNKLEHQNLNNTELDQVDLLDSQILTNKCFYTTTIENIKYKSYYSSKQDYELKINNYIEKYKRKTVTIIYTENIKTILTKIIYNMFYISIFLIIIITILKLLSINNVSSIFNHTDVPGKQYNPKDIKVTIDDIIGLTDTKEEIKQYIDYLKNRKKYINFGVKIPRGLLFIGPPGCGKTLLAKAIANKANVTFISVTGSDFHEMFVGVGAARIRNLFALARSKAPCIVFIDEIDSLGQKRNKHAYNSEGNSVLNKLLFEMDGFEDNNNILIIAATNRVSILDPALLRSGRFDRKLVFDKPNINERKNMFLLYLNKNIANEIKSELILTKLAQNTAGLTGADINTICNQAGVICIRKECVKIIYEHLEEAIEEIMVGNIKRERLLSDKEKERIAYHEAGHCLLGYIIKYTSIPIKVSIIPRGEFALGYSQQEPSDQKLYLKEELYAQIIVLLGGRVAEKIKYNTVSTGATDDLEKATKLCNAIITKYGFTNSLAYYDNESKISETQLAMINKKTNKILFRMYKIAYDIIKTNINLLEKIAIKLLENEIINNKEIEELCGIKLKNTYECTF